MHQKILLAKILITQQAIRQRWYSFFCFFLLSWIILKFWNMKLRVIIISSILWFPCDILALAYTHAVQECLIIVTMSYFVSISQTSISCRFVLPSSFHCLHKRISRKAGKNITSHSKICLYFCFFLFDSSEAFSIQDETELSKI